MPTRPGQARGLALQRLEVELAVRRMGQGGVLRPALAQDAGDAPGVDAGDGGDAVAVEPGVQTAGALRQFDGEVDVGAQHHAAGDRGGASISSSLVPTLPIWGKVKVTIWPA